MDYFLYYILPVLFYVFAIFLFFYNLRSSNRTDKKLIPAEIKKAVKTPKHLTEKQEQKIVSMQINTQLPHIEPFLSDESWDVYDGRVGKVLKERKIKHLIHFTSVRNLESIFRYGICPITILRELGISYYYNDPCRYDDMLNCVNLSIEYPNCKLLYKLRKTTNEDYCILKLSAEKLLLKTPYTKYFMPHNAASKIYKEENMRKYSSAEYFDYMFKGSEVSYIPTDVQSEILFRGCVHPDIIEEVHFVDKKSFILFGSRLNKEKSRLSTYYFTKRSNIDFKAR